jgi:SAM-dependent methyltransferase
MSRRLPEGVDASVPNVARMYDYYLGGKDNFAADRAAAEEIMRLVPETRAEALSNRAFLRVAVRYLTAQAGISQFLDIGTGLPTQGALHEVAAETCADARVAYADYDPVVVMHAQAVLASAGRSIAVRADLRDPAALLASPEIRNHLDFTRPAGVFLLAVLHFIADEDNPAGIIATLRDALAPGSYLVISHIVPGRVRNRQVDSHVAARIHEIYGQATERLHPRTPEQVTGLLDGFELIKPEALAAYAQFPDHGGTASASPVGWRVLARKPLRTARPSGTCARPAVPGAALPPRTTDRPVP